jgi:hypothetical protein
VTCALARPVPPQSPVIYTSAWKCRTPIPRSASLPFTVSGGSGIDSCLCRSALGCSFVCALS